MKEFTINKNEEGQRFDKYLGKLLSEANMSFIYKMLRKKNFTLNDKKADGKEILSVGDHVKIFLSDETFEKFSNKLLSKSAQSDVKQNRTSLYKTYTKSDLEKIFLPIIYEDEHILIFNKPVGMLSQKSEPKDISVNEYLIGYLLGSKQLKEEDLATFKPSISNRLDRNTSGAILCGKSLAGLQFLAEILKNRTLHKYYKTIVYGKIDKAITIDGYLEKNHKTNTVSVTSIKPENSNLNSEKNKRNQNNDDNKASYIKTSINPIGQFEYNNKTYTEIEVLLVTGKTHQIRAHLSSIGHPLIGDFKYGGQIATRDFPLKYQLLHAHKVVFPECKDIKDSKFEYLSKRTVTADLSKDYQKIMRILKNGNMV